MNSKRPSDTAAHAIDLPTTERDVEALQRARQAGERSLAEVFDRLSRLDHLPTRDRTTSRGWKEFVLS